MKVNKNELGLTASVEKATCECHEGKYVAQLFVIFRGGLAPLKNLFFDKNPTEEEMKNILQNTAKELLSDSQLDLKDSAFFSGNEASKSVARQLGLNLETNPNLH